MELPDYDQVAKWLQLFGENAAMAVVAALVYAAIRPTVERWRAGLSRVAVGVLLGLSAIISITYPIQFTQGVLVDMRYVFVLVGGLSGGVTGAAIAAVMAVAYRLYFGGPGVVLGCSSIIIAGLIGVFAYRRYGERIREFGVGPWAIIGLATGVTIHALARAYLSILAIPKSPLEATIAIVLLYPAVTAFLGMALNMVHYSRLERAQHRFADIAETTSDLIWETDTERRLTYVSERYLSVLGLASDEVLGRTSQSLGAVWVDKQAWDVAEAAIEAHEPFRNPLSIPARDGTRKIFSMAGRPRFDERGRFIGYRGTATDVTDYERILAELREREEELRLNREHLLLAQRVAGIASGEVDLATSRVFVTDTAAQLLDMNPAMEPMDYDRMLTRVHPDDRARMADIFERTRQGENTPPVEFRFVPRNGPMRWLRRMAAMQRDAAGTPTKVISTYLDITEQRRTEAELIESEAELKRSQEHLIRAQRLGKIGSAEVDVESKSVYWSDEVYRIFGLDPKKFTPGIDSFLTVLHPDQRDMARNRDATALQGTRHMPTEYRILRPDGETRWIYLMSEHILGHDGRPKILYTCHDITDAKYAEEERDQLSSQLTQAQKMEAVGNLTGGVAHDFNNLLSVILGRLEIAEDELADRPEIREWIATCIRAAKRGAALTRSMLAFSRQQTLQPANLDLGAVVGEMMELLPRTLGETIEIRTTRSESLWPCRADPAQVQTALLNLALNARDAMPQGGTLTIETANAPIDDDYAAKAAELTPGDYVSLAVSDTGEGMPPHVIARAFEPFFTTKEVGKGSGLGLSMVYGFVKQSGGHLKIYSEVGIGTTVRLYFPRGAVTTKPLEAAPTPWQSVAANGETVLVVEDDDDMRALAITQLQRLGYLVFAGANAAEGIRLVQNHPQATLLLTDITLPGGRDGRDMADEAVRHSPRLKVVYMSGYSESVLNHRRPSDTAIPLLQKPFSVRELTEKLKIVMS